MRHIVCQVCQVFTLLLCLCLGGLLLGVEWVLDTGWAEVTRLLELAWLGRGRRCSPGEAEAVLLARGTGGWNRSEERPGRDLRSRYYIQILHYSIYQVSTSR